MFATTETILNRIVVFVRRPIRIDGQFSFMFRGKTELERGRYYYNYPVSNISTSRLVRKFRKIYGHHMELTFAYGGLKDM